MVPATARGLVSKLVRRRAQPSDSNKKSRDTVDAIPKFRGVADRGRDGRFTVDVRWDDGKFCRECNSREVGAFIYDLAKLQENPRVPRQNLNSNKVFLEKFISDNPFPELLPREELMAEIMIMARKALEEWEKILGAEDFQEWSARGYPPKEPASTNIGTMTSDRFLQSEHGAADRNGTRIGFTNEGLTAINSIPAIGENVPDEGKDAFIQKLIAEYCYIRDANDRLKADNDRLKADNDLLKAENERLKTESVCRKTDKRDETDVLLYVPPPHDEVVVFVGRNRENCEIWNHIR